MLPLTATVSTDLLASSHHQNHAQIVCLSEFLTPIDGRFTWFIIYLLGLYHISLNTIIKYHTYNEYSMGIRRYPTALHKLYYRFKKDYQYSDLGRALTQATHETHNEHRSLKWVNPDEITRMQMEADETNTPFRHLYGKVEIHEPDKARFHPRQCAGIILDGDWDTYTKPHEYDRVYQGLDAHVNDDIPLLDTEYGYQYKLRAETYQDDEYLQHELKRTTDLIDSIRENGFQSRYELGQLDPDDPPYLQKEQWSVTVNIDRNGDYIFNNTAHNRLALAKLFNIDKIPVTVVVKHQNAVSESR